MRYHSKEPDIIIPMYGELYSCNHPVYDRCTLFKIRDKGLAVIQQRCKNKVTWWSEIDEWIANDLYLNPGFKRYFDERADECKEGLYPTVTVRQIMWALRMKPLQKEQWETCFDRKNI